MTSGPLIHILFFKKQINIYKTVEPDFEIQHYQNTTYNKQLKQKLRQSNATHLRGSHRELETCADNHCVRPCGTGPVGPAMARPTFELGRTFFKIQNKIVKFLESKVYTIKMLPILTGK